MCRCASFTRPRARAACPRARAHARTFSRTLQHEKDRIEELDKQIKHYQACAPELTHDARHGTARHGTAPQRNTRTHTRTRAHPRAHRRKSLSKGSGWAGLML